MATLELKSISKRFPGGGWGVRSVDITVADREFVVLLGPSGCGKTTTLRLVAGLEDVTSGAITLDGSDITFLPPGKRHVSMVFQNYAVWPHMTVFENIAFPLRLKKIPEGDITAMVREVAALTKIEDCLDRHPEQLSGGQQQRVAVARSLAVRPKLFLMDEPFSNLDASLRVAMRTELRAIHQEAGATTLFVTHDQAEAMSIADRIVIMNKGEIVQTGTPDEVYHVCANMFVAGFIGTPPMNFFDMGVKRSGETILLELPSFSLHLARDHAAVLASYGKERVFVGIRPEDMLRAEPGSASIAEKAVVVEPQGSHQVVSLRLGDRTVKTVIPPAPKLHAGETIHLALPPEKLHFFDVESGERL